MPTPCHILLVGYCVYMQGAEGVPEVMSMMHQYDLNREDWDSVVTLSHYSGCPEVASQISSQVSVVSENASLYIGTITSKITI